MADPQLDEDHIIALLQTPPLTTTWAELQKGAVQAMMDIYDRKVVRDEFIRMVTPCLVLYGQAAKLSLMVNVSVAHDQGDVDAVRIKHAIDGLASSIRDQSERVIDIVKRLKECPTSKDTVS